jgi:hypothetical protein
MDDCRPVDVLDLSLYPLHAPWSGAINWDGRLAILTLDACPVQTANAQLGIRVKQSDSRCFGRQR